MATIPTTTLGTSDPVDLCKGFALFPQLGVVRAGVSINRASKNLFRVSPRILMWKLNANAQYSLDMGVCGPSYAFKVDAQGSTEGNSITLQLSNDQIQAGLIVGMTFGIQANIKVQQLSIQWVWDGWHSHIRSTWDTAINLAPNLTFDLINIILSVLLYIDGKSENPDTNFQRLGNYFPSTLASYGFFDAESNQIASQGSFSAEPAITLPINLALFIPELKAINEALAALWGGLAIGPQIGISIPTTVKIDSISVDGQNYPNLQFSNGVVSGTGGTATDNPQNLSFVMKHTPFFEIQFGGFVQFSILKFVNIGLTESVDVLNLLGIKVPLGTYANTVTSKIGQDIGGTVMAGAGQVDEFEILEVELAPPGVFV